MHKHCFGAAARSFYLQGEGIIILHPVGPGGGCDRYARLVARHMPKHLPGRLVKVPKNMPGAGRLVLANYMFEHAPRDGSAIAGMQNERVVDPILKTAGAKFSGLQKWIGNANLRRA